MYTYNRLAHKFCDRSMLFVARHRPITEIEVWQCHKKSGSGGAIGVAQTYVVVYTDSKVLQSSASTCVHGQKNRETVSGLADACRVTQFKYCVVFSLVLMWHISLF